MTKESLSARISGRTADELEKYAEKRDITKSEATNRLLDKALKVENNDAEVIITDGSGDRSIEEQVQQTGSEIIAEFDDKLNTEVSELEDEIRRNPWELRTFSVLILLVIVLTQFNNIALNILFAGTLLGSSVKMVQYELEVKR